MQGKTAGELTVCDDAYRPLCRQVLELKFQLSVASSQNLILRNQLGPGCRRHGRLLVPPTIVPRSTCDLRACATPWSGPLWSQALGQEGQITTAI
jgi:hypothetical protein